MELARWAAMITTAQVPNILDTLAAAYAETGRYPEAVRTARKALQLASQRKEQTLEEALKAKIALYEAGTPYRETPKFAAAQ